MAAAHGASHGVGVPLRCVIATVAIVLLCVSNMPPVSARSHHHRRVRHHHGEAAEILRQDAAAEEAAGEGSGAVRGIRNGEEVELPKLDMCAPLREPVLVYDMTENGHADLLLEVMVQSLQLEDRVLSTRDVMPLTCAASEIGGCFPTGMGVALSLDEAASGILGHPHSMEHHFTTFMAIIEHPLALLASRVVEYEPDSLTSDWILFTRGPNHARTIRMAADTVFRSHRDVARIFVPSRALDQSVYQPRNSQYMQLAGWLSKQASDSKFGEANAIAACAEGLQRNAELLLSRVPVSDSVKTMTHDAIERLLKDPDMAHHIWCHYFAQMPEVVNAEAWILRAAGDVSTGTTSSVAADGEKTAVPMSLTENVDIVCTEALATLMDLPPVARTPAAHEAPMTAVRAHDGPWVSDATMFTPRERILDLISYAECRENGWPAVMVIVSHLQYHMLYRNWLDYYVQNGQNTCLVPFCATTHKTFGVACNTIPPTNDFHAVLVARHAIARQLVRSHLDVIFSDVDAFWIRSPLALIESSKSALVVGSRAIFPQDMSAKWSAAFCTGFFIYRAHALTEEFISRVLGVLEPSTDQRPFNHLLGELGVEWDKSASSTGARVSGIEGSSGTMYGKLTRLKDMPIGLFGHVDIARYCTTEKSYSLAPAGATIVAHCALPITTKTHDFRDYATIVSKFIEWKKLGQWRLPLPLPQRKQ